MTKVIRGLGWTFISVGVLVLLYLVYLLFFTGLETTKAQDELLDSWTLEFGDPSQALPGQPRDDALAEPTEQETVDPGNAYAAMWFERPGSDERPVNAHTLFVVEGVSLDVLKLGPGHYPRSSAPGQPGNFAISGHRTTYAQPFYDLNTVEPGDEIHVVDREQREWVYVVREQRIVAPTAWWVVGPDPLETGRPTMTITTCHPRFSAAQRLIVFAELRDA